MASRTLLQSYRTKTLIIAKQPHKCSPKFRRPILFSRIQTNARTMTAPNQRSIARTANPLKPRTNSVVSLPEASNSSSVSRISDRTRPLDKVSPTQNKQISKCRRCSKKRALTSRSLIRRTSEGLLSRWPRRSSDRPSRTPSSTFANILESSTRCRRAWRTTRNNSSNWQFMSPIRSTCLLGPQWSAKRLFKGTYSCSL